MTAPRVIVLNGVGSFGKSATARAIQARARAPWLHLAMDGFLAMLPPSAFGSAEGLRFVPLGNDAGTAIKTGPRVAATLAGMRRSVAALAGEGLRVIVDDVILDPAAAADYRALIGDGLRMVALHAPLAVIAAREAARGDRTPGLARWQHARVHRGLAYDLEVDTAEVDPDEVAAAICAAFGL